MLQILRGRPKPGSGQASKESGDAVRERAKRLGVSMSYTQPAYLTQHFPETVAELRRGFVPEQQLTEARSRFETQLANLKTTHAKALFKQREDLLGKAGAAHPEVRAEIATQEVGRILGILALSRSAADSALIRELVSDPTKSVEAAKVALFDAGQRLNASRLQALKDDEAALGPIGIEAVESETGGPDIRAANDYAMRMLGEKNSSASAADSGAAPASSSFEDALRVRSPIG